MPDQTSRWSAYRDLDSSPALEASLNWLERFALLEPTRSGKRRSHDFLGVRPGDRVLDVGCGTGVDVLALAELTSPGGEVYGVDSSAQALAQAQRQAVAAGLNARFELADATALPFPDDHFDASRCDRTLQHLADPQRALNEMARVTRRDGIVLVSEVQYHLLESQGCELPVLHQLLELHQTERERAGWIGFIVPLLFQQAGLSTVTIATVEGTLDDSEAISGCYDLDRLAAEAVVSNSVTEEQIADLYRALKFETTAGRLRVIVQTHIFFARVCVA